MPTYRRIRTLVVSVPDDSTLSSRRFRPSDLVPWSDPYIAGLVETLQAEVRAEQSPGTARLDRAGRLDDPSPNDAQGTFRIDPQRILAAGR